MIETDLEGGVAIRPYRIENPGLRCDELVIPVGGKALLTFLGEPYYYDAAWHPHAKQWVPVSAAPDGCEIQTWVRCNVHVWGVGHRWWEVSVVALNSALVSARGARDAPPMPSGTYVDDIREWKLEVHAVEHKDDRREQYLIRARGQRLDQRQLDELQKTPLFQWSGGYE